MYNLARVKRELEYVSEELKDKVLHRLKAGAT
jgi:hypothetical protein